jgi:GPH family glycoside/pentoside/hexuronide:cation symporter
MNHLKKNTKSREPANNPEKLSLKTKIFYALGNWGNTTTTTIFGFFFAFFLTDVVHLKPILVAPILLLGGVWDAINDPLVGVFVDRVRSRWGRRRPFFLFGAVPYALFFIMLWWIPPWTDQIALAIYYIFAYLLYDTAFTVVSVPYSALTPELTEDYDERTSLNGYSQAVSIAGGLIAAISVPVLKDAFPEQKTGFFIAGLIFGILAFLPYLLLFFTVNERFSHTKQISYNAFEGIRITFRNKAFLYAAGIFLTAWAAVNLVGTELLYYLKYLMDMEKDFDLILGLLMGFGLFCVPLVVWLSGRKGKKNAYVISMAWWIVVMLILFILPQEFCWIIYILAASAGLGVAAAHVIPSAMIPDVIEQDELETGLRREGTFYGILVFFQKVGTAAMLALAQFIFAQTGYVADAIQNGSTIMAIRIVTGLIPAILLAISLWLAWKFPIDKQKHLELRNAVIKKRKEAELS